MSLHVRHLDNGLAVLGEDVAMPSTKPFRSATWASTLFAWNTSARRPSETRLRGEGRAEELGDRGDPALLGDLGDVPRGLDPEHGHAGER